MPDTLVDVEMVKRTVQLACRAPSLHNSQPWRWELDGGILHLFLEESRLLPATDCSGREALISCGAALDHLRWAAAATGWAAHVERFPNPNDPDDLAAIHFTAMEFVTDAHRRRADAILLRRTDRLPFAAPTRWELIEPLLRANVDNTGVRFDVLAEDARRQLVEASMLTESLRLYDSSYHAELDWWTAAFEMSDGIPRSSLVSAAESERVDVGRTFRVTGHGDRRAEVPEDQSKIVVLSTRGATREDALRSGEALSGVLLDATMLGLSTCTLTHITELAASRDIVAALIGQDTIPQVLVRVGEAPSLADVPPPTPRRPIDDVLTIESGSPS